MDRKLNIHIKRIYENPSAEDGYRILIDRLWPRGVKKESAKLDEWNKNLAPSTQLRKQFNHQADFFNEFSKLYREELSDQKDELDRVRAIAEKKSVTLLYGAKDTKVNHAIVLCNILNTL